ncbi:MAG: HPF/RaiA family ribosome-associated protein [Planctomycetaceae bacterium]|nr:HPF/RaiA family ribosome-associated protein [Planctomycetaceae bacterium]
MNLEIHASRVRLTDSIRLQVQRRIEFATGRFHDHIERVSVLLEDTNGPRGGDDKLCRIRVHLVGDRQPLIAETTQAEVSVSIDVAADNISRQIAKRLDRRTESRRHARPNLEVAMN